MRIKDLCKSERPRERLVESGSGALSDGELLAVLIGSGTGRESAIDLSRRILSGCGGSLVELSSIGMDGLLKIKGIGPAKAAVLTAAFELGRRFSGEGSSLRKVPVTGSGMVYSYMKSIMKGLDHEECWILFLNRSNYITGKMNVARGGGVSASIDIKQILSAVVDKKADSLILVHNHPSGNPFPSRADVKVTQDLKNACTPFGTALLDHVIVCDDCYFSFADEGTGGLG